MSFQYVDTDLPPPDDEDEAPPDLDAPRIVDPRTLPARFHHLRQAGLCGALALHAFQGDSGDSLARRLGSGTHAMLLGKPWVPFDLPSKASLERRAKVMKEVRAGASKPLPPLTPAPRSGAEWKKFVAEHPGMVILTKSEVTKAQRMADAIRNHPIANRLLFAGDVIFEQPIIWAQNGRARQSTPDARRRDGSHNTEVKTARSVHPVWFKRDAERFGYHAQLADQAAAIEYETGDRPDHSYIIAVESSPPHIVQVYELAPSALVRGEQLCSIWIDKLQIYEATNTWGGYSDRIEPWEVVEPMDAPIADPDWLTETGTSNEGERQ